MSIQRLQFFMRTSDLDVEKYLKLFTLLPVEEISSTVRDHQVRSLRPFRRCDPNPCQVSPERRIAQKLLAEEVTLMVHGRQSLSHQPSL